MTVLPVTKIASLLIPSSADWPAVAVGEMNRRYGAGQFPVHFFRER